MALDHVTPGQGCCQHDASNGFCAYYASVSQATNVDQSASCTYATGSTVLACGAFTATSRCTEATPVTEWASSSTITHFSCDDKCESITSPTIPSIIGTDACCTWTPGTGRCRLFAKGSTTIPAATAQAANVNSRFRSCTLAAFGEGMVGNNAGANVLACTTVVLGLRAGTSCDVKCSPGYSADAGTTAYTCDNAGAGTMTANASLTCSGPSSVAHRVKLVPRATDCL